MRFERLTATENSMYAKAMELYRISFPFHEQREAASQAEIMGREEYQFQLIYDENRFLGLLLCWETASFIYVEHFCILPEMRGKQYGQRALQLLGQRGKTVILEIDPPKDELSARRKAFYERASYKENGYDHDHPAYHAGYSGHHLVVMSCPKPLTPELYEEFFLYLKTTVMGA